MRVSLVLDISRITSFVVMANLVITIRLTITTVRDVKAAAALVVVMQIVAET
jgi:hypothetical protein